MDKYAIVLAGGMGSRMQAGIPKQFIRVQQKTILDYTLDVFASISDLHTIVVLPDLAFKSFEKRNGFTYCIGGSTRHASVKSGLKAIDTKHPCLICIHDGARPLVNTALIKKGFSLLNNQKTAIPCVSLKDSIRQVDAKGKNKSVSRNNYKLIQTPQFFTSEILLKAYQNTPSSDLITDDASLVEKSGTAIHLFEGEKNNIKITYKEDLEWFKFYAAQHLK